MNIDNLKPEVELNFKNILKDPTRWFGYLFVYFAIVIFALGILFLYHVDFIQRNETSYVEPDSATVYKDVKLQPAVFVEGVDINLVRQPTEELLRRGEEIYRSQCYTCHGNEGRGDGLASVGLNPPPRSFHETKNWKNGYTPVGIYKTLKEGIPNSAMVSYEFLTPKDRIALIHFIYKLSGSLPKPTEEDFVQIEKEFNVSQNVYVPPRIPIQMAEEKILTEAAKQMKIRALLHDKLRQEFSNKYTFVYDLNKFSNFLASFVENNVNISGVETILVNNLNRNGVYITYLNQNSETKNKFLNDILNIISEVKNEI